jgi:predicted Zn-dependent protease
VSSFFYNLGRQFGEKAMPALRKSKWLWKGLAGSDEEAFRAEVALGVELAKELQANIGIVEDPAATGALDDLCLRLSSKARDKRRTFRCTLFKDPFPNAIGLPGGLLYFSHSLLELCEFQTDEMAFVAGHEMAHLLLGHTWDRMLRDVALQATSLATARVGPAGAWLREHGEAQLRNAQSRTQEFKADELAFCLAAGAGISTQGGFNFLQRVQRLEAGPEPFGQFLAAHPPAGRRIARLSEVKVQRHS